MLNISICHLTERFAFSILLLFPSPIYRDYLLGSLDFLPIFPYLLNINFYLTLEFTWSSFTLAVFSLCFSTSLPTVFSKALVEEVSSDSSN